MSRASEHDLLLGEWACLGILYVAPAHGFAVAARLKPDGDVGRVWSLTRPLTYRSLDQLVVRGYAEAVASEPGIAGGNRTILAPTRSGRSQLRAWLRTPVLHLRDLRSELLLKLVLAELCGVDVAEMVQAQRSHCQALADALTTDDGTGDVVQMWRAESSLAAVHFLDRVMGTS